MLLYKSTFKPHSSNWLTFAGSGLAENSSELLLEYIEPGADFWADEFPPKYDSDDSRLLTVLVQWILKCRCTTRTPKTVPQTVQQTHADANGVDDDIVLHRVHRT